MFMMTQTMTQTMPADAKETNWMITSSLTSCAYRVMANICQEANGNVMPSKLRQRHVVKDMRSEDPQMRH